MPSRLQKPNKHDKQRLPSNPPQVPVPDFDVPPQDFALDLHTSTSITSAKPSSSLTTTTTTTTPSPNGPSSSRRTLAPPTTTSYFSRNVRNSSLNTRIDGTHQSTSSPSPSPRGAPKMVQTIRTVPSFEAASDTSSDAPSHTSAFSSSVNSNASAVSMASNHQERTPGVKLKHDWPHAGNDNTIKIDSARREETPPVDDENAAPVPEGQGPGWDSTIGKAGLGKTGRVINKLVSDNEALKRDIQIERLRAEEAKQAAKLVEDKMERIISDYESRLLEASVTKTLLSRKERQVETLHANVELEKKRTADAKEKELLWRDEMEKMRASTTKQVEDANTHAALMEGRYNAISSHWKDQGDEVQRAHLKLRSEIAGVVEERRRDDEKIAALRDLCDQQDGNIKELRRQKEEIQKKFDEYKAQQEFLLKDIKAGVAGRDAEQERLLEETRSTLAKLKWALNVKENVKDLLQ
ncbi:hypothetical protein HER10_EVM0013378 [Colletotrichum scovillei]|uniref:SWI5-dependent HO expression protein 3 n=1 Tax=Colletotrichum scovillei TaxID=1209932 RepID=A0A9P7RIU6_9PEZI|nr:uncharacterized protein HER10_EVM0013378 [Colletotrichum scovillei]KAF4778107.1 hypothetical protein HER10_EVM0013378 [Colletotrichum scovillei]KAG7058849.1 hypothetical protein JMJ77_0006218 [Colletotrichum scovillei]KAG7077425.1 hypothetical protein JMJ76_0014672 [Colletotrichum scovillei]KAG7084588.1 hypothetical protein JMJ78_0010021 [Colletotrichum scovillei]